MSDRHKVYILVLLQAIFFIHLAECVRLSSCQKDEKCTRLVSCSPLMNILRPRGMTQAEKDVFANRQCGLDPNGRELLYMVYVCCPELGDVLPSKQTCGKTTPVLGFRGAENAELKEYPWMVLLLYENRLSLTWNQRTGCVGSLINSRYVLTAAHCVIGGYLTHNDLVLKSVRLGESHNDSITSVSRWPHLDVEVGHTTVHQGFTSSGGTYHNDIALLRLRIPLRYTKQIQPICLLDADFPLHDLNLQVSGWDPTKSSQSLITSTIKKRNPVDCLIGYTSFRPASQICAGGQRKRDTCAGISGSPLMGIMESGVDEFVFLEGIASYGQQYCYTAGIPGVYTKIDHFLEWIKANLAP
ncbi:spaetzle-processing enzyme [Drosophila simulans]|uniref:spaetzle-processing enzyme n=1 Tax=Drosophila simulans TaxID=7240 RepID=UPI00078ADF02|nr:spaetzle-processing enzyme [Drosophila simulans]KMZ05348.1 uncharacterized protein Dsimw501_GD21024 [Drosophila simulans]